VPDRPVCRCGNRRIGGEGGHTAPVRPAGVSAHRRRASATDRPRRPMKRGVT
jgi:hypothetical protein